MFHRVLILLARAGRDGGLAFDRDNPPSHWPRRTMIGRSNSSLRFARQRPWRVRPASPGRRRVQRTCDSIRTGPMPVRTSIARRVPGGSRVGSSTATPPPLMSVVRPRHTWGVRLARREHRTGRLITKRACLRATRFADGDRTGGRDADPSGRSVISSFLLRLDAYLRSSPAPGIPLRQVFGDPAASARRCPICSLSPE